MVIKLLPFILIPVVIAGVVFWRIQASKDLASPTQEVNNGPVEVPKTLPGATLEERVQALENSLIDLINKFNSSNQGSSTQSDSSLDSRLTTAEAAVTELKARVTSLENSTAAPSTSTSTSQSGAKSPVYIPLGNSGQISDNTDWISLGTFQATVDPAQYPSYTSMQLQVNMRLNQPGGKVHARLYNSSTGALNSSEVSTDSTSSTLVTSTGFTLSSGSKTYTLQAKSSAGTTAFIDNASIKVNF